MGDDAPGGTATFHAKFSFGPNLTGGFFFSATPEPLGPRNCGQSAAKSSEANTNATRQPRYRIKVDSCEVDWRGDFESDRFVRATSIICAQSRHSHQNAI